jgi:hypothetical protein
MGVSEIYVSFEMFGPLVLGAIFCVMVKIKR